MGRGIRCSKPFLSSSIMFGPRRFHRGPRRGYRRGTGGNFGLLLLGLQIFRFIQYLSSRDEFIPTTLVVMAINVLMFIRPSINGVHRTFKYFKWPSVKGSCISVQHVWFQGQWGRTLLAPLIHGDSFHLYYNMASFMWKSRTLERHYGTPYYAYLTTVFTLLCSIMYLLVNFAIAEMFDAFSYIKTCAVGFSGVIFALKVVTTHLEPPGMSSVFGIPIPKRLAVWGELVVISVLFPNASFTGHLAGILVGVAYVSGPLKQLMDIPIDLLSGYTNTIANGETGIRANNNQPSYNYTARSTGTRDIPTGSQQATTSNTSNNDEDEELQEGIRRSLNDRNVPMEDNSFSDPPPYNPDYNDNEEQVNYSVNEQTTSAEDMRTARLRRFNNSQRFT